MLRIQTLLEKYVQKKSAPTQPSRPSLRVAFQTQTNRHSYLPPEARRGFRRILKLPNPQKTETNHSNGKTTLNLDPQLLQAAQRGDRKAQYALYRSCFPVLMAVCMRYRRDKQDAVSAVNNGFLKIIQNLDKYKRDEVPFEAWIRRIMINTVIDEFRREKKWRELTVFAEDIERSYPHEPIDWNEAEQRMDVQHLEALLQRLPPMTQKVFNLFALDGFSHHEISEMLGMSEGTSKWHVSNARAQLQSWIKTEMAIG